MTSIATGRTTPIGETLFEVEQLAAHLKCSVRTIRRYEREPDGLPL